MQSHSFSNSGGNGSLLGFSLFMFIALFSKGTCLPVSTSQGLSIKSKSRPTWEVAFPAGYQMTFLEFFPK